MELPPRLLKKYCLSNFSSGSFSNINCDHRSIGGTLSTPAEAKASATLRLHTLCLIHYCCNAPAEALASATPCHCTLRVLLIAVPSGIMS